jgi:porphobilinogen synthase
MFIHPNRAIQRQVSAVLHPCPDLWRMKIRATKKSPLFEGSELMKPTVAPFPAARLRRMRKTPALRALARQHTLTTDDLIWPVFVMDGKNAETPVASMPGVVRRTVDRVAAAAREAQSLGIPAICIFPYTGMQDRTEDCAMAWDPNNLTNQAIRAIKDAAPDIAVMTDIALDPYNINGHDGFVENGQIVNDRTVAALVKMALAQAEAGADILGPSDMMDGRIGAIRTALEAAGHHDVTILSYTAKYASSFYGPFRDAVGASSALTGDKKTYQMDPGNSDEALRLVARDLAEGADMIMVKPGMPYLDICRRVKDTFGVPTYAYQVSGEYAMIQAAAQNGWLDGDKVMLESLLAFKRAGCDGILTYFAPAAAKLLNG